MLPASGPDAGVMSEIVTPGSAAPTSAWRQRTGGAWGFTVGSRGDRHGGAHRDAREPTTSRDFPDAHPEGHRLGSTR